MDQIIDMIAKFDKLELVQMNNKYIKIDLTLYNRMLAVCRTQEKKLVVEWYLNRKETEPHDINYDTKIREIIFEIKLYSYRGENGYGWQKPPVINRILNDLEGLNCFSPFAV